MAKIWQSPLLLCDNFYAGVRLPTHFSSTICLRRSDDDEFDEDSDSDNEDEDEEYEEQDTSGDDVASEAVKAGNKRKASFFFVPRKLNSSRNLPITYRSIMCYTYTPHGL